jgi:hypothetical protein
MKMSYQLLNFNRPCDALNGNRPLEPRALEVEFFPMEEVLHEKVKIH